MEYVPCRVRGFPTLVCKVDVDKGERFVRYWSTVHAIMTGNNQRLYIFGVENRRNQFALMAFYVMFGKVVLAATKPFNPPWFPNTLALLPPGSVIQGGVGMNHLGWLHEGFGGLLATHEQHSSVDGITEGTLSFSAIYG
jgi:hypothetical protein